MIFWALISNGKVNKRERGRTRHVNYTKHCYLKVWHDCDTKETECDAIILSERFTENRKKSLWYAGHCQITVRIG